MQDQPTAGVADSRRSDRAESDAPLRMRIVTQTIEGMADNLSEIGLMFFTENPLRVEVDIEEGGSVRTLQGRLVRAQRLNETNTGIAIEFDPK